MNTVTVYELEYGPYFSSIALLQEYAAKRTHIPLERRMSYRERSAVVVDGKLYLLEREPTTLDPVPAD